MTTTIPSPVDASRVGYWELDPAGQRYRFFHGTVRQDEDIHVDIFGVQNSDGSVRGRRIAFGPDGDFVVLDAAAAREMARASVVVAQEHQVDDPELMDAAPGLAALLLAAADEIEALS